MREEYIPASLQVILASFAKCFTAPSFCNFVGLVSGWILCQGKHRISRLIQSAGGPARRKHFSTLYRFLSRGRWTVDELGRVLFHLLLPWLPTEIEAMVDDTLCHRSGPHIFGAGMHHDASRSTYGRGSAAGRQVFFAFGQNWVVLALRVPLPWDQLRGIAVPILFRLFRPKRRCSQGEYRKRTELAGEMVRILEGWIPAGKRLYLAGDAEYACKTLVRHLADTTCFVGPMHMKAELREPAGEYTGVGRPRKVGRRLPSPADMAADQRWKWNKTTIRVYGRTVKVLIKTQVCLWYRVAGTRLVRVVVTRDPRGRIADRAYFMTEPEARAEMVLQRFSRRWMIEVCFRDAKQSLGIEDPQNGWGRRKAGSRRGRKRAGPQPRGRRGSVATLHTLPLAFVSYGIVVLWYLQNGQADADVSRLRQWAPWHRKKTAPSFHDMLVALRREIWAGRLSENPQDERTRRKVLARLPEPLLAA